MNIDYEAMSKLSQDLSSKSEEFKRELDNIIKTTEDLSAVWVGTNAASYTKAMADQAESMKQLHSTLVEAYESITKINQMFMQLEENTTVQGY